MNGPTRSRSVTAITLAVALLALVAVWLASDDRTDRSPTDRLLIESPATVPPGDTESAATLDDLPVVRDATPVPLRFQPAVLQLRVRDNNGAAVARGTDEGRTARRVGCRHVRHQDGHSRPAPLEGSLRQRAYRPLRASQPRRACM